MLQLFRLFSHIQPFTYSKWWFSIVFCMFPSLRVVALALFRPRSAVKVCRRSAGRGKWRICLDLVSVDLESWGSKTWRWDLLRFHWDDLILIIIYHPNILKYHITHSYKKYIWYVYIIYFDFDGNIGISYNTHISYIYIYHKMCVCVLYLDGTNWRMFVKQCHKPPIFGWFIPAIYAKALGMAYYLLLLYQH